MKNKRWLLSTIAPDAADVAREYGLGLEIAEYCTAYNMDVHFTETDEKVRKEIESADLLTFHAPFNELFPCAIDLKVREVAAVRYNQAIELANTYGVKKIVIHSGYTPTLYYPIWFEEQSVGFWKDFLQKVPDDVTICMENVFEEEPDPFLHILENVNDPRLKMCLDIGHVSAYSKISVMEWLEKFAPWIRHFHIHNNDTTWDSHQPLANGAIPMEEVLRRAVELCPEATFALELMETRDSVEWLKTKGFLED